ncbi:MAG: hypothetical protein CMO06_06570 [Thalassospira sp.]|nr:hypothetical protein [Thalassospira sp.]|tara:strand:- start:1100 stop:1687 length:588 start_codon:yes stop_codon:yes gene_type:complete
MKEMKMENTSNRAHLNFTEEARKSFSFLLNIGFIEVEALPTLVRYRKDSVEVDVYHGRQSYEIGCDVTSFGTRYAISEIIRANDPETGKHFRYPAATTAEEVVCGLEELSELIQRYCRASLDSDSQFFSTLDRQRKLRSREYALDVLARQLRPEADEAFRKMDYSKAAETYSRIRERLSPAEVKKLNVSIKRSKN